uniref:Uncharacterized protein n=1 Tax=Leersia perrieri TaxID=77586 RepID=A0A0D9VVK0_9ORYZ
MPDSSSNKHWKETSRVESDDKIIAVGVMIVPQQKNMTYGIIIFSDANREMLKRRRGLPHDCRAHLAGHAQDVAVRRSAKRSAAAAKEARDGPFRRHHAELTALPLSPANSSPDFQILRRCGVAKEGDGRCGGDRGRRQRRWRNGVRGGRNNQCGGSNGERSDTVAVPTWIVDWAG